jgi:hypothetical protein
MKKQEEGVLLRWALYRREVFVHSTVEGFELLLRQTLLVLIADVDAGFLKSVDEGRIGSDIGHRLNKDVAHLGIGGLWLHFASLGP